MAGTSLLSLNYQTISGDRIVARGNSQGMVTKVKNRANRRNEVSYNDKIWVQRLGKARYPHLQKCINTLVGGLKIR